MGLGRQWVASGTEPQPKRQDELGRSPGSALKGHCASVYLLSQEKVELWDLKDPSYVYRWFYSCNLDMVTKPWHL